MYRRVIFRSRIHFQTTHSLLQIDNACPLCKSRVHHMTRIDSSETVAVVAPNVSVEGDELDDRPCRICGDTSHDFDHLALLCDGCEGCFHTFCLGLGSDVPEGQWYCPDCAIVFQRGQTTANGADTAVTERKEPEQKSEATPPQTTSEFEEWYCAQCSIHFAYRWNWRRHMRAHRGQQEMFRCQYCSYGTSRRSDLTRHCTRMHPYLAQGN